MYTHCAYHVFDREYLRDTPVICTRSFLAPSFQTGAGTPKAILTRLLGAILATVVAACPVGAVEPLPTPSVDGDALYDMWLRPGEPPVRVITRHSGGWYRSDMSLGPVLITAFAREGTVGAIYIIEAGSAKVAFRVASIEGDPMFDAFGTQGTRLGEKEILGERCDVWRLEPKVRTPNRIVTCVTRDGIALDMAMADTPGVPVARAVRVQRRPQDPALFTMMPMPLRDVPDYPAFERELATWANGVARRRR